MYTWYNSSIETRSWSKHFDGIARFPIQIHVNFMDGSSGKRWQYRVNNEPVTDCLLDSKGDLLEDFIFKSSYQQLSRANILLLTIWAFTSSVRKFIFEKKDDR